MTSILELFSKLSSDELQRGRQFERICKWFLENDPEYKRQLKRVWLWNDWPHRWGRDKGIDLIAEGFDGTIWAIQAKAYAPEHAITKKDLDKFLSESSRRVISYRLLIGTASALVHNAREVIQGQEKGVGCLLLADLKKRTLNWPASPDQLVAKQAPPHKARPDQRRAISDVISGFRKHERGQLIRACGTGKTLIGLRVSEAMKSQRTLVLVPSLSLLSQALRDWTTDTQRPFRFLPVCSDETIGKEDHLVSHVSELGVPATTDAAEVAKFMRGKGPGVIFCTYQSTPIIAQAFKRHRLLPFDLALADEAHRCAGSNTGPFATILDSRKIRAKKRLFMTATPRIASEGLKSRAEEAGIDIVSMDDPKAFGPVFHELKFSDAIKDKLLTDYRVEIIGVDDPMCRKYAEQGVFVTMDGETITDATTLASHIAVAKAAQKHDLRRIITFHGRVSRAREFAEQFPQMIRWMPKSAVPSGQFWAELISGEMPSIKRDAILDRLREVQPPARGLVSNARCLGEGVDVRALDGVAFIDPKESQVDIIQAVGRAIRKAENKKHGIIILPVYISGDEDEEKVLADSSFKQVWRVLRALRSHDDQLADELDNLRTKLGKRRKGRISLPAKITIDFPHQVDAKFADAFYLRTVQSITPSRRLTEEQILEWADFHHKTTGEWPKNNYGNVLNAPGEKWMRIQSALQVGSRNLPGGSSLAQLLAEKRGVRNVAALPTLTEEQILKWADLYHEKIGEWPNIKSGNVAAEQGEHWKNLDASLYRGVRSLPGGSSLAQLLAEKRGVRNRAALPTLTESQILEWTDLHHKTIGQWPIRNSGDVLSAPGEKWRNINNSLMLGLRGLPGDSSLAQLLAEKRSVRSLKELTHLTESQILEWADLHHKRVGEWPNLNSGNVFGTPGEKWKNIDAALYQGLRGLSGGSSVAQLLAEHRGVRNRKSLPKLTEVQILKWSDLHHKKKGKWPNPNSGDVFDAPGEKWSAVNGALEKGRRGLNGGSSLARLLDKCRSVPNPKELPPLTEKQILKWADFYHKKKGEWPNPNSGDVFDAPGEKWSAVSGALAQGRRGLPGGASLAQLLAEHRGARNRMSLPKLTEVQILKWSDLHLKMTGEWPNVKSVDVLNAPGESWRNLNGLLHRGGRGLPGGSSLAQLLAMHRGIRNLMGQSPLTEIQILEWADLHHHKTGKWPIRNSGDVLSAPGEKWRNINNSLMLGLRDLPGGSSLSQLLARHKQLSPAQLSTE